MSKALTWFGGIVITVAILGFLNLASAVPAKVAQPEFVPGKRIAIPITFAGKTFVIEGTVEAVQTVNRAAKSDRLPLTSAFHLKHSYFPNCSFLAPDCRWPDLT